MFGIILLLATPGQVTTNDPVLKDVLARKITYYDHKKSYQHDGGLHDVFYNISAVKPKEKFGNPNREFPWGKSGGTHRSEMNIKKFYHIPGKISYWNADLLKLQHWATYSGGVKTDSGARKLYDTGIQWKYPEDTIFGEIFYLKQGLPFEVRIRHKVEGRWNPSVYRPIVTREEYDEELKKYGIRTGKPSVSIETLESDHPQNPFYAKAAIDKLPAIPEKVIRKMLTQPFKRVKLPWIVKDSVAGHAPTTDEDFHIVPAKYDGGFISPDRKGCMMCHSDTLREVSEFDHVRDWYGRVRGSDGIFSFSIFKDSSIDSNGFSYWPAVKDKISE